MPKIIASAPGKLILHGEHAVVFGKAAVALSIGLRTKVEADLEHNEKEFKIVLSNLKVAVKWKLETLKNLCQAILMPGEEGETISLTDKCQQHLMDMVLSTGQKDHITQQALLAALYLYISIYKKYSRSFDPLLIDASSELPLGAGLGSSGSYAVCLSAVFLAICGKVPIVQPLPNESLSLISRWAFQAEKILHGQPSGIDNSICTRGGALLFKEGKVCQTLNMVPPIKILLINTKVQRNTKVVVAGVRNKYQKHKDALEHVMCAVESISEHSWKLLQESSNNGCCDLKQLKELIMMNHHLLNVLEVGHPQLDAIHELAKEYNFAAKLTGAGCGGCAFVLLSTKDGASEAEKVQRNLLQQKLTNKGFDCFEAVVGCPGVTFY